MNEQPLVILHNTDEPRDVPEIPLSDAYTPTNLQDPCFLYAEIHRLWELHQRYDGDVKAEKTKLTEVGKSLGEVLYAMKVLNARVGRNGGWSRFLRRISMNRATADRLVSRYAESKGLTTNRLTEAIKFAPPDVEVSRLTAALWPRIERSLHSPLAHYMFLQCVADRAGLQTQLCPAGVLVFHPDRVPEPKPADMTAERLKSLLKLTPLSIEGGYFSETYRSTEVIPEQSLPERYRSPRAVATAIYYLLEPGTFSEIHRVASDEIFHFYLGDPVEMLQLWPDGSGKRVLIGADVENGMAPQVVVPHGVWQGARLVAGGKFALMGCTVSPGFEYADYESGSRKLLSEAYPECQDLIGALTR